MNKYYDLKIQAKTESYVKICFLSKEICKLNLKFIEFYYENTKVKLYDDNITAEVLIYLDGKTDKYKFFSFPKKEQEYTSLNFIIKDMTHRTQHAIRIPLDGTPIIFTEMIYGE